MYAPQFQPEVPTLKLERKPGSITFIQVATPLIALGSAALYFFAMQYYADSIDNARELAKLGLDVGIDLDDTPEDLATGDYLWPFVIVCSLPVVLLILSLLFGIGLQRRRRWARLLTAIWTGIALLPAGLWAAMAVTQRIFVENFAPHADYYLGPIDPFTLNAVAAPLAFGLTLVVFILALKRGARQWAPKKSRLGSPGSVASQESPVPEWGRR